MGIEAETNVYKVKPQGFVYVFVNNFAANKKITGG